MENCMEVFKKLKVELLYDPSIPHLGIYLKKKKTNNPKDMCTPMFIATLFIVAKTHKQPKCLSTDEWVKKIYIFHLSTSI